MVLNLHILRMWSLDLIIQHDTATGNFNTYEEMSSQFMHYCCFIAPSPCVDSVSKDVFTAP